MPSRGRGTRFRLAITYNAGHQQVWIIQRCSEGSGQGITQLATFMNRSGNAGIKVTREAARPRETADEEFQAGGIQGELGIEALKAAFHIEIGQISGCAMTGPGNQKDSKVFVQNKTIELGVNEIYPGTGSPMAQQPAFDMGWLQRFFEQHIFLKIDLRGGQIIYQTQILFQLRK